MTRTGVADLLAVEPKGLSDPIAQASRPSDSPPPPTLGSIPIPRPGAADALLLIFADALDDLERVRIATDNRSRALRQIKGLDGTPEEARLAGLSDALAALEHGAELELKRALRTHPLGPWMKRTVGVGEKQGARLLAAIGDPSSRRTVSQLWAYCGYHVLPVIQSDRGTHVPPDDGHPLPADHKGVGDQRTHVGGDPSSGTSPCTSEAHTPSAGVAPSRKRGQKANWNSTAKMRAFLVAESCIKHRSSPYRAVYDAGRVKYAEAVHPAPCQRCGPAGKPAVVGSPLSDGHKHARALRLVAKAVLKDLWIEARRIRDDRPAPTGAPT
jgi:hypothetical protein